MASTIRQIGLKTRRGWLIIAVALLFSACQSAPEVEELSGNEAELEILSGGSEENLAEGYERLKLKDVRGGKLRWSVPGRRDQVVAALLDFDHSSGNRSWAKTYVYLGEQDGVLRTRWKFDGQAGINPEVILGFRLIQQESEDRVQFRLLKKDYGLAAFFGDFRITEDPQQPGFCWLEQRIFIDSGLWIANASYEEIKEGLLEDARLFRAWMERRLKSRP